MSTHTASLTADARPHVRPKELHHLVRRHEDVEARIAAAASHGIEATELWLVLSAIEFKMAHAYPRAFAHWIAVWAIRQPQATHAPGQDSPECALCQQRTAHLPTPRRQTADAR